MKNSEKKKCVFDLLSLHLQKNYKKTFKNCKIFQSTMLFEAYLLWLEHIKRNCSPWRLTCHGRALKY